MLFTISKLVLIKTRFNKTKHHELQVHLLIHKIIFRIVNLH